MPLPIASFPLGAGTSKSTSGLLREEFPKSVDPDAFKDNLIQAGAFVTLAGFTALRYLPWLSYPLTQTAPAPAEAARTRTQAR